MVATVAACGGGHRAPEADPAQFLAIADHMVRSVPAPAAVPTCKPAELVGVAMTRRTLLLLDHQPLDKIPELADWMNPDELDAPAAQVLADPNSDDTARRRATAELLAAPAYFIYRLDLVGAPIALGVHDLKIGTVGGRLIKYDTHGLPTCVVLFQFQNDKDKSDRAIALSRNAPVVDPQIAKEMQEDLYDQYVIHAPRLIGSAAP